MTEERNCPECNFVCDEDFCLNCGADLASGDLLQTLCPGCNISLSPGKSFCAGCGYQVGRENSDPAYPPTVKMAHKTYSPVSKNRSSPVYQSPVLIVVVLLVGIIIGLAVVLVSKELISGDNRGEVLSENISNSTSSEPTSVPPTPAVISSTPIPVQTSIPKVKESVYSDREILKEEINYMIYDWIASREALQPDWYMSHYGTDFYSAGKGMNYYQWKNYKTDMYIDYRAMGEDIQIIPENIKIHFYNDNKAKVSFLQYYYSHAFDETGMKSVVVEKRNGRWLIVSE